MCMRACAHTCGKMFECLDVNVLGMQNLTWSAPRRSMWPLFFGANKVIVHVCVLPIRSKAHGTATNVFMRMHH